ncbi:MAG: hypothetical protein IKH36_01390 [Bacilli bacterium]|nr:hypothetical protein [Bacilli bacterium]MBR4672262.1 hypothetical protein [Bacilli bacterium]
MKTKICLIICWFGKFPNYFELWEKSCGNNPNIDFFVITNNDYKSKYSNIIAYKFDYKKINALLSKKLNLDINIEKPYKFCDFKPVYGIVFSDYIKKYDFWGHCDMDQIFGDISTFLNDSILNAYDRVNHLGHFTLYRNTYRINNLYKENGAKFDYKKVFTSKENFAFDEFSGVNLIFNKNHIKTYEINDFADIDVKHKRYLANNLKNYNKQYFEFNNGKLYQVFFERRWKKKPLLYLHFQKKHPVISIKDYHSVIRIGKEGITDDFNQLDINRKGNYFSEKFETIRYYNSKVWDFIKSSNTKKGIWFIQKFGRGK